MKPWPSYVATFLTNDFAGILRKAGYTPATCPIQPEIVGWLLERERNGEITRKALRALLRDTLVELKKDLP